MSKGAPPYLPPRVGHKNRPDVLTIKEGATRLLGLPPDQHIRAQLAVTPLRATSQSRGTLIEASDISLTSSGRFEQEDTAQRHDGATRHPDPALLPLKEVNTMRTRDG